MALQKQFGPLRVQDVPPDETTLLGLAAGLSQCGLTVVCEIPYAKYLDCGADMFFEMALMHWLSNGKQPNGLMIRLQGFGEGIFGGNFHTHNMLHLPPGVDVVAYSNARDYARGWRYSMAQVRRGRLVMSVDSTALLYVHDLYAPKDLLWDHELPDILPAAPSSTIAANVLSSGPARTAVATGCGLAPRVGCSRGYRG